MPSARPPRLRLFDILDSIHQIERTTAGFSSETLKNDILRHRAVERWLEIISEASRHIGDDLMAKAPEVPWRQVADFGNVMRHGYEAVSASIIWNIIVHDLPVLKIAATRLYIEVKRPADPWPDSI